MDLGSGSGFGLGPLFYFMSSFNFEKTRRKNFKCDGELPLPSLIKTSFTWLSSGNVWWRCGRCCRCAEVRVGARSWRQLFSCVRGGEKKTLGVLGSFDGWRHWVLLWAVLVRCDGWRGSDMRRCYGTRWFLDNS